MGTGLTSSLLISSHCITEKPRSADPILGGGSKKKLAQRKNIRRRATISGLSTYLPPINQAATHQLMTWNSPQAHQMKTRQDLFEENCR